MARWQQPASLMAAESPTELRLHWSAQCEQTWAKFRPQFEALLPALSERLLLKNCRLSCTSGDDVAPADTVIYVGPGPAFTGENLGAAKASGSLKAVVLPYAGVPPVAVELLSRPLLAGVRL